MPRKPKLLPYVRLNRQGRLQYYRRVPPEQRHLFGGKGSFTVVLDVDPTKPSSKAAHKAWAAANQEYEQRIKGELAPGKADSADVLQAIPLSPRDAAGIAAEPLRNLLNAGDAGQITQQMEEMLATVALIAGTAAVKVQQTGDIAAAQQAKAEITQQIVGDLLQQLHIQPDQAGMAAIQQRLLQYLPISGADAAKRGTGDFSPGRLQQIAPPVPKTQVTYQELVDQWLTDAGGFRTDSGSGISQKRYDYYLLAIRELIAVSGKDYPAQLTVDDARAYVNHLQQTSLATGTKQARTTALSNLFGTALRFGLLDQNVFSGMTIKKPKNSRPTGYRPFTKRELTLIVREFNKRTNESRVMIAKALLCTGARSSDISQLRHKDIKQTEAGVYYFDFVDEPLDQYPHPLKGGASDERKTPLHPWLIEQGFLSYIKPGGEGFVFGEQKSDLLAQWMQFVLKRVGVYEKRVTTLHSLRGTWIDLMREARLPQDVRRAITGHSARDVQDKVYGEGLQMMPDVLYEEIIKIDLSWLP